MCQFFCDFAKIAAISDESVPPDKKEQIGTSEINFCSTDFVKRLSTLH